MILTIYKDLATYTYTKLNDILGSPQLSDAVWKQVFFWI